MSSMERPPQESSVPTSVEGAKGSETTNPGELASANITTQNTEPTASRKAPFLIATLVVAILVISGLTAAYLILRKDSTPIADDSNTNLAALPQASDAPTPLENVTSLETFKNEYFSIKHPPGWQLKVWDGELASEYSNEEYKLALHPADADPIQYYKLPLNIDEGGDLADGDAEGLYINIEDNIVYLTLGLPPEEYAKAVKLSGKPALNIVGMPAAKNIYRENVAGKEYVSQWVSLPLYRNAEARWLLVIYRVPANEFNEQTADTVMQSLTLNKEFWKTLTVEEAQQYYNQHAEELKEYNGGKFITGEDLLKDEAIKVAIWLGLRDPL